MRIRWGQFGGQLGVGFFVAGLVLVFLGWNGAASWDRVPSQFPYLISGGVAGLCLVVIGAALVVVQAQREDRSRLEARLAELRDAIARLAPTTSASGDGAVFVVAGPTSFHRPTCRLVEGRGSLPTMTVEQATAQGLRPCRTCDARALLDATTEIPAARRRREP